jgi:hypothetical protein
VAEWVCCPKCWSWSQSGKSVACRRCGTALIHADGRRVDDAPPPPPPMHFAYQTHDQVALEPQPPPLFSMLPPHPPAFIGERRLIDWVEVTRWITIGYGALTVMVILGFGLLVRHITVSTTDPITGFPVTQTVDIGAAFVVVALIVAVLFGVFAWLTQFTLARCVFLLLDGLAVIAAFANMFDRPVSQLALSFISLAIDAAYGYALAMSLVSVPPRPH